MAHCENCGSKIGIHGCEWCNEELYIIDQYHEEDMELPSEDSEFMQKANEQQDRVADRRCGGFWNAKLSESTKLDLKTKLNINREPAILPMCCYR